MTLKAHVNQESTVNPWPEMWLHTDRNSKVSPRLRRISCTSQLSVEEAIDESSSASYFQMASCESATVTQEVYSTELISGLSPVMATLLFETEPGMDDLRLSALDDDDDEEDEDVEDDDDLDDDDDELDEDDEEDLEDDEDFDGEDEDEDDLDDDDADDDDDDEEEED